jgi:hypothetical protein
VRRLKVGNDLCLNIWDKASIPGDETMYELRKKENS